MKNRHEMYTIFSKNKHILISADKYVLALHTDGVTGGEWPAEQEKNKQLLTGSFPHFTILTNTLSHMFSKQNTANSIQYGSGLCLANNAFINIISIQMFS